MTAPQPKVFSRIAAVGVGWVGGLVLLGWTFDSAALKSLLPGWPKVSPLTMLAFLLAAISLWCAAATGANPPGSRMEAAGRRGAQLGAGLVALIGLGRLGDYVSGWNLNFDTLGFHEVLAAGEAPAQMAPATALEFLLIGSALLVAGRRQSFWMFQVLVLATGLVAWLGFSRYLYGGEPLLTYAQMSVSTAFCFLLLSGGAFCLRADRGLLALAVGAGAGGMLVRRLLPPALAVPFFVGWLRLKAQQAGWFGTEAGLSLFALFNALWFALLIWANAYLLQRTDLKRRQADEASRVSEELFAKSFRLSPDCVAIVRLSDRTVIRANEALCQLWGSSPEEVIGKPTREFTNWLNEYERLAFMATLADKGECLDYETTLRLTDGRLLNFNISARMITFSRTACVLSVMRDITERKHNDDALKKSRAEFKDLFDHAPVGYHEVDAAGRLVRINQAELKMLGYSAAELLGQFVWKISADEALSRRAVLAKLAGEPPLHAFERTFRRKDGTTLPVLIEDRLVKSEAGVITGIRAIIQDITERKQAEEQAAEEQARFKIIFESMPVGIAYSVEQPNGRYNRIVNDAHLQICGLTRAQDQEPGVYRRLTHPEDAARQQQLGRALGVDRVGKFSMEKRYLRPDGQLVWVVFSFQRRKGAEGTFEEVTTVVDITERKRTEERFRRLVDSNVQGVIFWNKRGEITGANDAFLRIVGYTREDLEAGRLDWAAMTPPEYARLDWHALGEMAAGGICTPFEKEYFRQDGTRVPILLGAASFEDNPDEGVCFLLDITERKRTEQALRASEEHFRFLNDLVEATRPLADPAQIMAVTARMLGGHLHASRCAYADVAPDSEQFTILHDYTDGCASTVGRYQLSLFGERAVATLRSGQTLIIRNVAAELLPGEGADMFTAIGIQAIITCPLVKAGQLRAMMAVHQTTPRDWRPGEIAIVQDVVERCWATIERRTAEEKIHQLNTELEQRVIERTAQLETANKELEAFSYSVSHDLRAPLRAVNGFAGIVLEDFGAQLPEEGRKHLERIRNGGQRMGQLIDDLLTFSRLSRHPVNRQTVDPNQLVQGVLDELPPPPNGRPLAWQIARLPACSGDPALLKQVWVNLLSNAIKYTHDRAPARVEIGCTHENGRNIYFVRDNGVGFDMQYAGKLFGVFQRLHRADEFEGTGVGLAIVQRIVHRHGGRVWAEAKVNQGATFYFTIEAETKT